MDSGSQEPVSQPKIGPSGTLAVPRNNRRWGVSNDPHRLPYVLVACRSSEFGSGCAGIRMDIGV